MSTLTTVPAEVTRDRWGRPLIIPPGGGRPRAYTRATTLAGAVDDLYGLMKWKQRQTALGLADRPDLQVAITAHRDDKTKLDQICEQAMEAAASSARATIGTAVHKLTELVDRGQDLPTISDDVRADLDAYAAAMKPFRIVAMEQMLVLDDLQIAGTPDRIVEWNGQRFIADLKTGSDLKYSLQKIAMQLALYSRSAAYNPATGDRTPIDVHQRAGLVIHVPAGTGTAEVLWIDLTRGWEAVELAVAVRDWRKTSGLTRPFTTS